MRKKWLVAALVAAILGLIVTGISISEYFNIQKEGLEELRFCSINEVVNCDIVNASSYSEFLGIPVAIWGLLFYLTAALYAAYVRFSKKERRAALSFIWAFSIFGVLWNIRMAYIAVGILHAACLTCFSQYAISLFLAAAFTLADKDVVKDRIRGLVSKKMIAHVVTLLIIFGIGYVFALSTSSDASRPTAKDIKEIVAAHFRQSLYDIKPEDIANAPVWGNKDAKIIMIEFSDFECPVCRIAAFNVRPYLQEFRDKVKFVFLNYPLDNACNHYMEHPMHQGSCIAAEAAVCAQEKGRFWEYHDLVFRNQRKISRESLLGLAEKVGIDKGWMEACMDSPGTMARIKSDIEVAHHIYLIATPSIFINQRMIRYWRIPEILRAIVKEEAHRGQAMVNQY